MADLLDQFGTPIPSAVIRAMREEIAPPGAQYGRPPLSGHLAFGIEPGRLGAVLRGADAGDSLGFMILAEEVEELFPHYAAVLAKRRRQVSQLPITIEAAAGDAAFETHADLVRDWVDGGVLQSALFDITDAIGKGYSIAEIMWDTTPGRIVPAALCYRPPRWFEVSYADGRTFQLRTETGLTDLMEHKFLRHLHPSKSGLAVRSGLTRAVMFLWLYAGYTARDWAIFTQAYGLPIRVGRYGPEASETDKRVLWRAVSSIAGDVAAIIPKSMELEFVKATDRTAGAQLFERRADWLNREVSKLVLGGTAGTEAISGGHAVGQEHRQVEDDVEKFDAGLLSTSITRQLVQKMVAFTFGPQARYPVLKIGRPNEVPLAEVIDAVAKFVPLGLTFRAEDIRNRLGLTAPDGDDEVLGGAPAAPGGKPAPDDAGVDAKRARRDGGADTQSRRDGGAWLGKLITRHAEAPPELVEQLTDRLAADAAGALAGMTAVVRQAFEDATDLPDLAARIHKLKLPDADFAEAMARGMALAQMVGQASLVDELRREA